MYQAKMADSDPLPPTVTMPGNPSTPDVGQYVGHTLDNRYHLEQLIGRGGMGSVYLARHVAIGRRLAVKILDSRRLEEGQGFKRLFREAQTAAGIGHPNIVEVVDVGTTLRGDPYLVMEYVDGPSLSEIVRIADQLPLRVVGRVLADVLEALDAAHNAIDEKGRALGVVHRDFSPQNILVGADGRSRLTDFGIARATTRAEYTRTGLIKGKVAYMAPEQAAAERLDVRADVWAAGVVAWELFAGQRMYPRKDPVAVLLSLSTKDPRPLDSVTPGLDRSIVEVVHRALQRDRTARWPTARAFREKLLEALGDEVASHDEVGDFVNGLTIPRLVGLRETIRTDRDTVVPAEGFTGRALVAELPTVEQPRVADDASEPVGDASELSPRLRLPLRRVLPGRLPIALFAVVMVGVLAWVLWPTPSTSGNETMGTVAASSATRASPSAVAERALSAEGAGVEGSGSSPRVERKRDVARAVIQVSANEPIEVLFVGERSVVLKGATKLATVELTDEEAKHPPSVRALTKDGRDATGRLTDDAEVVELLFPAPRPAAARRAASPLRAPRPTSTDELAPMPY